MLENSKKTELEELGEFGLIDHLSKSIKLENKSSLVGIGDDAAVIDNKNKLTVVTTDTLVEGVHFDLTYVPLKHLGYKAVIVNLSDVYAMNATPKQITVSIALSSRFPLEAVEEIYKGITTACDLYKVDVVGGDTSSSLTGLMISVTAIGQGEKKKLVYRNGAKENDLLVVTGDLGGAYMGLQILEREKEVYKANSKIQPDLDGNDYILERQLKPEARKDIIELLEKLEVQPTSMIDISDGLASEIMHLTSSSKVGCSIYDEKIPIDPSTYNTAREFNLDPLTCSLNGGEDYELLFTVSQKDYDKIKGNPNLTVIGHITDQNAGINLIDKNGVSHVLKAQGWSHFNS